MLQPVRLQFRGSPSSGTDLFPPSPLSTPAKLTPGSVASPGGSPKGMSTPSTPGSGAPSMLQATPGAKIPPPGLPPPTPGSTPGRPPTGVPAKTPGDRWKATTEASRSKPLDAEREHRTSTLGTYMSGFDKARLTSVFNLYGPKATQKALTARTVADIRDGGDLAKKHVQAQLADQEYRAKLFKAKDALFWKLGDWRTAPADKVAQNVWPDYVGSVGELMDESRVRARATFPGPTRSWTVTSHGGGSGAAGADLVVFKKKPNGVWRVVVHEVKLTPIGPGKTKAYGYGKTPEDYAAKRAAGEGLPVIYRSNYLPTGARRRQAVELWAGQYHRDDPLSMEDYLVGVVNSRSNSMTPLIRQEVATAIRGGDGSTIPAAEVVWKYSTYGRATVDPNIGVAQTKLGARSREHTVDPLRAWLDTMGTTHRYGESVKAILRDIDTSLAKPERPETMTLRALLTELHALLLESPRWPAAAVANWLGRLVALAPRGEVVDPEVALAVTAYDRLVRRNLSKQKLLADFQSWTPT
jgi:hypothetical protein